MYVVGVGLVKVYKALIRLVSGALSIPLLMGQCGEMGKHGPEP